jgi:hypothetical protein
LLLQQRPCTAPSLKADESALLWKQIYQWKEFNLRDDLHIKDAIKRSNVVINLIGADRETWNYSFEDVHIDAAARIAQAAADNPLTERFIHFSCIGAREDAKSRRLKTKVLHFFAISDRGCCALLFMSVSGSQVCVIGYAWHCFADSHGHFSSAVVLCPGSW